MLSMPCRCRWPFRYCNSRLPPKPVFKYIQTPSVFAEFEALYQPQALLSSFQRSYSAYPPTIKGRMYIYIPSIVIMKLPLTLVTKGYRLRRILSTVHRSGMQISHFYLQVYSAAHERSQGDYTKKSARYSTFICSGISGI